LVPGCIKKYHVPGVAVGLIQNGESVFQRGYGYRDKKKKRPVTAQTGFNVGSISKSVAAWGVMRLVEEGKLELDTPVEEYLTRWHLPRSRYDADGVTVRRLLCHTAGLSLGGYPGWSPKVSLPTLEESLSGKTNGSGNVRLIMEPGTKLKYSGGGYTILQLLIEEVGGQPFPMYMKKHILEPLGMTRSGYELTPELLSISSETYNRSGRRFDGPRFTAKAAAGLQTTLEDLTRFTVAVLEGRSGKKPGRGILKPETISLMLSPAPATDGGWGLGYIIRPLAPGMTLKGHSGGNMGWVADFWVIPETGDGLVMLTNSTNGGEVCKQIHQAWVQWLMRGRGKGR
jgi:CubicO group peptidase (beta-lactamase class C family)